MRPLKYLIVGIALAVGCVADDDDDHTWIVIHQARIAKLLQHPESAQFRSVRVSRKSGSTFVCGEVASSSVGGKPEFRRFISVADIQMLEPRASDPEMDSNWARLC